MSFRDALRIMAAANSDGIDQPKPDRIDNPGPDPIDNPKPPHIDTPRPDRVQDPKPVEEPPRGATQQHPGD